MTIATQLQAKGNVLSPNVRVDDSNLITYDGNPQNVDTDPLTNTVGERAIIAAPVSTLYSDSNGRYYVKTEKDPMKWEAFGSGSAGGADEVILETVDDDWRIINEHPYLKFQREEVDPTDDSKTIWRTHASLGSSLSADGIVLTKPYSVGYDLANTQDTEVDPDLVEVISITGQTAQNLTFGNSRQQTVINTERGNNVMSAHTLATQQEVENRSLKDVDIVIDRRDTPEANSITELSWITDINFSHGSVEWIRFNEVAFDVFETSDDVNGVPIRFSIERLDGTLVQENMPMSDLEAGVRTAFRFSTGTEFKPISPAYEERQSEVSRLTLSIPEGAFIKLRGGNYDYQDSNDVTQTQDVPYQKSRVEYFSLGDVVDSINYRDVFINEAAIAIDIGKLGLSYTDINTNREVELPMIGVSEHDDLRNVNIGNFNNKTYVNAGEGGLWSLVEDPGTDRTFWSSADLAAQNAVDPIPADQFIEVTSLTIDLNGALQTELDALEDWTTVNCLNIILSTDFRIDPNPDSIINQHYRTVISAPNIAEPLQQSVSEFEFDNGFVRAGYTIPVNPEVEGTTQNTSILLPRETYTLNATSERTVTIQFTHPTRVYGWYDNPVDPDNPTVDEFVPSIRLGVRRVNEKEILTGATLDERLNEILGSEEYRTAQENQWNTLHIDPEGKQVLADTDGNWILFWDTEGLFKVTDMHQYMYRDNRESIYAPTEALNFTTHGTTTNAENYLQADPLVLHIKEPTQCRTFNISLLLDDALEVAHRDSSQGVQFTFYINTYENSNSHSITVNVPWDFSIRYSYTSGRGNAYTYRAQVYNDSLATTQPDLMLDIGDIPNDPNVTP